jgi:hypothetical protein
MRLVLSLFIFNISLVAVAQLKSSENWTKLSKIAYDKTEDEYGEIYVPKFSTEVKQLAGKTIALEGFIVPFDGLFEPKKIIVSSLPIASCFFCGGSGPETVAEVYLKESVKYTAKAVRVTGTLVLNDKDYNQLMYVLKDAKMEVL